MTSGTAEVVSWSKDSIYVRWKFEDDDVAASHNDGAGGYVVRYQAVGSSVTQVSVVCKRFMSF